jgi:hypothetical protein
MWALPTGPSALGYFNQLSESEWRISKEPVLKILSGAFVHGKNCLIIAAIDWKATEQAQLGSSRHRPKVIASKSGNIERETEPEACALPLDLGDEEPITLIDVGINLLSYYLQG